MLFHMKHIQISPAWKWLWYALGDMVPGLIFAIGANIATFTERGIKGHQNTPVTDFFRLQVPERSPYRGFLDGRDGGGGRGPGSSSGVF
jgi:hypothetical protein